MFKNWTWDNLQSELNSPNFFYSIVHGDVKKSNILVNPENKTDLVLLDWELAGWSNPAIDLTTLFGALGKDFLIEHEDSLLHTYHNMLGKIDS